MAHTDVPGAPIWVELYTSDPDAATAFYSRVFGWTVVESGPEFGGYRTFEHDGGRVAGCMRNDGITGGTDQWCVYLESDDVEATVRMAEANGGSIEIEPTQVGDLGHMAFVRDPAGELVGIWQPGSHDGIAVVGEPGTPGWFELFTSDFAGASDFYTNAFGWALYSVGDSDDFRYSTLGVDEDAVAGVMDVGSSGDPTGWSMYVAVGDADAAVTAAVEAGGSVTRPAEDTPYGRLAWLTDPTGCAFKVLGPTRETGPDQNLTG